MSESPSQPPEPTTSDAAASSAERQVADVCPRPLFPDPPPQTPLAPPLYMSSVYRCETLEEAEALLAGREAGYVYSRDGHPNAKMLAEKCRLLHAAERAAVCGSGTAALTAALVALLRGGDHLVASDQLYGGSLMLIEELARLGIESTLVNSCDLAAVRGALRPNTRLVLVETLSNPLVRVADIAALAEMTHQAGAVLLVDNTFAGPALCRPLEQGADLVLESLTKIMGGHSDTLLGALCGRASVWERIERSVSVWGLSASPFDSWLALRGMSTLALRTAQAGANAQVAARFLADAMASAPGASLVEAVHYPGLAEHPDHALAGRLLSGGYGNVLSLSLRGGRLAAQRFIDAVAQHIPLCPSLGDVSTTLTHPATTSHRNLGPQRREALGIGEGTLRLSVGIESPEFVVSALRLGLTALASGS